MDIAGTAEFFFVLVEGEGLVEVGVEGRNFALGEIFPQWKFLSSSRCNFSDVRV